MEFEIDSDLEIGAIFEVAGSSIKVSLNKDIRELTKSYSGRVYEVGQIGSILKMHLGRRIILATVKLLRLQSDEEYAALNGDESRNIAPPDRRVIEADLLGEAWYNSAEQALQFKRGVSTYPLPLQSVHLVTKAESELLFRSVESSRDDGINSHVTIGAYAGATRVDCRADIDKLFSQHCAVLGSTGAGKSSAVAAILHSVLEHSPKEDITARPSIILIDPHGEYSHGFSKHAKTYRAYNSLGQDEAKLESLTLPYWLLSGDEFRSLVIGKTEFEATSQANTVYKALTHARMHAAGLVRSASGDIPDDLPKGQHPEEPFKLEGVDDGDIISFDRDKPRPFKLQEFRDHIEKRQCFRPKGDKWERVPPGEFQKDYASILNKIRVLTSDPRVTFMMKEFDQKNSPSLSKILSQFLTVGPDDKCLKIIDISGLPNEVAGPLTAAIARLLFQYKLHESREEREKDPVLLICEEAHRYVPNRGDAQYEVAQSAIKRIAREGRKYGLGLMLVSQRPADIEGTVISQCNSWIVLRLSNSSDQSHVSRFLPDALSGMTRMLSSLPRQEALFVGEAAAIPAKIKLRTLTKDQLPNSNDISFIAGWSSEGSTSESISTVADRMQI